MFIGAEDIKTPQEQPLQITREDLIAIEKRQKTIIAMIIALALLTLLKK